MDNIICIGSMVVVENLIDRVDRNRYKQFDKLTGMKDGLNRAKGHPRSCEEQDFLSRPIQFDLAQYISFHLKFYNPL